MQYCDTHGNIDTDFLSEHFDQKGICLEEHEHLFEEDIVELDNVIGKVCECGQVPDEPDPSDLVKTEQENKLTV